jgi:hypothetical protein
MNSRTRLIVACLVAAWLVPTAVLAAAAPVGFAAHGQNAFELVGRSDQEGATITHYGYLTHVVGLPDQALFSNPTSRNEASARFTYFSSMALNARNEIGNLISTAAEGTLTIYYQPQAGANLADRGTFARGTPIATYTARYHNILNVQAPNTGIASGVADLIQLTSPQFLFENQRRRLGAPTLRLRLTATGQGARTQEAPLRSFFFIGGDVVIVGP